MRDFLIQLSSNLLATLIGGALLFYFFEGKIRKIENENTLKRLFVNLYTETIRNYITAERIIESAPSSIKSNSFPISKFKLDSMSRFLYSRPIPEKDRFYGRLNGLVANLENVNNLLDLVFKQHNENSILENKKKIVDQSPKLLRDLNAFLITIDSLNKEYNFIDKVDRSTDLSNKV